MRLSHAQRFRTGTTLQPHSDHDRDRALPSALPQQRGAKRRSTHLSVQPIEPGEAIDIGAFMNADATANTLSERMSGDVPGRSSSGCGGDGINEGDCTSTAEALVDFDSGTQVENNVDFSGHNILETSAQGGYGSGIYMNFQYPADDAPSQGTVTETVTATATTLIGSTQNEFSASEQIIFELQPDEDPP